MDLHRPFKMDSPSYLPPPLASPALMVLASTAEAGRDASVPCQASRPFGVPVSMEKDLHLPFPSASYTFASMYQRQGSISGTFPSREFPASLLHLHPQFTPPMEGTPLSMLNHSGVGAFRPFSSPQEERESGLYQSAFTPAKRLKSCFPEVEGKEFDFGPPAAPLKAGGDAGRKLFSMSGLLSEGDASSSPEERKEHSKGRGVLYDAQAPTCPVCQAVLRPGELQEHMEQELSRVAQLVSTPTVQHDHDARTPKSLSLSLHIKREGGSPTTPPRPAEEVQSDRYQTFLRVRSNRHTRLNVDDLCWCRCYVRSAPTRPHSAGAHLDCSHDGRIGKLKRKKAEDTQEGSGDPGEEAWNERRRLHATSLVPGIRDALLANTASKDCRDSDADLDVDGDDSLEYGRAQYTETDVISCPGENSQDAAVNSSSSTTPPTTTTSSTSTTSSTTSSSAALLDSRPEYSKRSNEGSVSSTTSSTTSSTSTTTTTPSSGGGEKESSPPKTCRSVEAERLSEDSPLTTLDALKTRIRDLEKQLSKGDRFKCLICMDAYTTPLTSIQCWHVHCEECWLRTLGAKKLCPQCNTITSPGDLRRVFL